MTTPADSLESLERWMQGTITHPGGVVAGAAGQAPVDAIIEPSRALTATERLEIYSRAYFSRLVECLRSEYSVLVSALGEELFDQFALQYLETHPPQSYTLADLGNRFPAYLESTRPREMAVDEGPSEWPEFLIELARLELQVNQVFDGPGAEGMSLLAVPRLAAIAPDQWPAVRLVCVPCLALISLSHAVNDYFTALRRGEEAKLPRREPQFVAVTRRDYRVFRYSLERSQFELLEALIAGETVGEAIARAAAVTGEPDDIFAARLQSWFSFWMSEGFFTDVVSG